jgi:hypothetical protein
MSTDATKQAGLGRITPLVDTYSAHLQAIPAPPETFLKRDLPPETQELFDRLRENDVITRQGKDPDANVYRWRLDARVAAAADRFDDPPAPGTRVTPCCHYKGFANLRDGGFECGLCGEEFDDFHIVEEVADGE